ncbi:MAG: hypothetical protein K0R43_424 [Pseudoduganella sp.]|jgi:hypothetical protein|nr:hypothetical protein [Pseudoduganella sp.]
MSGTRQAALLLHDLAPADCDWLLQQLDAAEASTLQALLQELQALGIPAERGLQAQLTPAAPAASALLAQASAAHMLEVLDEMPSGLLAAVLSLESWPWEAAWLARLAPARRDALLVQARPALAPAVAAALRAELQGALQARVAAAAAALPAPAARRPWWRRWTWQR